MLLLCLARFCLLSENSANCLEILVDRSHVPSDLLGASALPDDPTDATDEQDKIHNVKCDC